MTKFIIQIIKKHFIYKLIILLVVISSTLFLLPQELKGKLTQNSFIRSVLPVYRSLKKIPDIVFAPYLFFENNLPQLNIAIAPESIIYLNNNLPKSSPFTSILLENNRVFVKALFKSSDYEEKVDVRYKGLNSDHWNSFKKSYRVKFSKDNLFNGASALNLVIPYDKVYYAELLNMYRAKKMGLLTPNMRLSNLYLNGKNNGVYLVSDKWSVEMLESKPIPDDAIIFGVNDGSSELMENDNEVDYTSKLSLFSEEFVNGWKSYTTEKENYNELKALLSIIDNADNETFKRAISVLVDLDKFYKWDILTILAGDTQQDFENLAMLFNTATGKFELVPIDVFVTSAKINYKEECTLTKRILSVDEFKEQRNKFLLEYIDNKSNLKDDLSFYDKIYNETRNAFFQDFAKKHNNFIYLKWVKESRQDFVDNFNQADNIFNKDYPSVNIESELNKFNFKGSFERFAETYSTIDQFVLNNYQFSKKDENTVLLPSGKHVFYKTVIIPAGINVIINKGASLYMDKDVSIISYSPVIANGTEDRPIKVRSLYSQDKWGVFAVMNAKDNKSIINYTEFMGGSGDFMNGVKFTGMVSFHNSNVEVKKSTFKNASDDDGLNVKYGDVIIEDSLFADNFSDGIDIDFVSKNAIIRNNVFNNNGYGGGGDAIDLSWTNAIIDNNVINGCTDKGISVGESSKPVIQNNKIEKCDIGVAVKDSSEVEIINNEIKNVRVGVSAYQKKQVFGGGIVHVSDTKFENVEVNYKKDESSIIDEVNK